jgi:hypothetical protein
LLPVVAAAMCPTFAGDIEDFDPQHPPLPEIGKKYRLVINPGKKAKPVALIFQAADEVFGEENGKKWTTIQTLVQEGGGNLEFESQGGIPNIEIVDYDRDGYLDFRVIAGWGSGGSWYNYYRFNGKRYVPWLEPQRLNISSIRPEESLAVAFGRSGPCWAASYYRMRGTRFTLFRKERYDQASFCRAVVPLNVPDSHYVLITETVSKNRIVHRNIKLSNPWEDERVAKVILDLDVDEPLAGKTK